MMDIVGACSGLMPGLKATKDDDSVDRLNNRYTVALFAVFTLIVSARIAFTPIIVCWGDKHLTGAHINYANSYCWVRNTYYVPWNGSLPVPEEEKEYLPYYQWTTFILIVQALGFYAPQFFWQSFNQRANVDADAILENATKMSTSNKEEDRRTVLKSLRLQFTHLLVTSLGTLTAQQREVLTIRERIRRRQFFYDDETGEQFGCYLVVLYIFTKFLYLGNVISQLFILNKILAVEYSIYGIEVMGWMMKSYDWTLSPQVAFPRVTMCDFTVRRLGNLHRYTVQCTLPINLYNEKIYMFLWFWMVFVALCTTVSLVTWILRFVMPGDRLAYIENHLRMLQRFTSDDDRGKMTRFTKNYLRHDGVFLLRLIGHNTNTLTVSEIIGSLWDNWVDKDPNGAPIPLQPTTEAEPLMPKEKLPE